MDLLIRESFQSHVTTLNDSVEEIKQEYDSPAKLKVGNSWHVGSCLSCIKPRCMYYSEEEIVSEHFSFFSYDRNAKVCPADAISNITLDNVPSIDTQKCISCGICVFRCPIGAIFLDNGRVRVSKNYDLIYSKVEKNMTTSDQHSNQVKKLLSISRHINYHKESESFLTNIYNKIRTYDGRSQLPNILARNLMIALGYNCMTRRTGDNSTRMDSVFANKEIKGVIEVEFGNDTLDASRGILDDIAILNSRYNFEKKTIIPLVICLSFSNKRQNYYQVVKDIQKIINVRVQTISIGALLLLLWNSKPLKLNDYRYYVDFDNLSIRNVVQNEIGHRIPFGNGFEGILEPSK